MREMQENYYLILFIFASQLYFYVLGPSSLLGYQYLNLGSKVIFVIRQLQLPDQGLRGRRYTLRLYSLSECHPLVKLAHVLNWIGFTIIDDESRLVKAMKELNLFNTLRKRGARNLKESFSHSIMPLASFQWCSGFLMIMISSRSVPR